MAARVTMLGLRIPEELHAAFRDFCKANRVTMEATIEHVIRDFLVKKWDPTREVCNGTNPRKDRGAGRSRRRRQQFAPRARRMGREMRACVNIS